MLDNTPFEEPLDLPGGESRPTKPHHFQAPKKKRNLKRPLFNLFILALFIGAGLFGYKVLTQKTPTKQVEAPGIPEPRVPTTNVAQSPAGKKTFTAQTQALSFDYPDNWTVVEKEGAITAASPDFQYQTTSGEQVTGHFKLYLRVSARDEDSKYIGQAVAIQPTETLTYANPAPSQLKTTRLSFFGNKDSDNFAFFMITNNFDLKKGDSLGPDYGKEASTYIIVGGYVTSANKDDLSFQMVPTDNFSDNNSYKQALDILKSLKVS